MTTSLTGDAWENLTNTVVATQQQTQNTFDDAKQAHAEWQKISLATIETLRGTKSQLQEAINTAKTEREANVVTQNATLTALEQKISALAQTVTSLNQEIASKEAHNATLQAAAQPIQQRIDYLLSPAGAAAASAKLPSIFYY